MTIRRKISFIIIIFVAASIVTAYFYNEIYLAHGKALEQKTILIEKGDNALEVGDKMSKAKVISGKIYLILYLWKTGDLHNVVAGVYEIKPSLTIPEIARIITGGDVVSTSIPITFPEGWTAEDMAERLKANELPGENFLSIVNNPSQELKDQYDFLKDLDAEKTLEGYLFPDTYYFAKDASADDIVEKMLKNFSKKISDPMLAEISQRKKTVREIIIMASIIEKEAKYSDEMNTVSSVFWNRLAIGQRLQSDATLEYVLKDNKIQHSAADLQNTSTYNTYQFLGLPPGPVSNPGSNAISAAIYPDKSDYYYFLTDLKTAKTIFSKTFEEHVRNKQKYGL